MALVKYNNNSISSVTSVASMPSGALTHIKTLSGSNTSTISFVHGSSDVVLDDTYPIYMFKFINIHPATDGSQFQFNASTDSGSNYNVTKTTTFFSPYHRENDAGAGLVYEGGRDLAQGTGFQQIAGTCGADNDQSSSGTLHLFNPASSVFVKHFISKIQLSHADDYCICAFVAGYGNTTNSVDAIRFQMSSGNIDSGDICLYGIA